MWKPIPGFEDYEASHEGQIRCKADQRLIRSQKHPGGYRKVYLIPKNGKRKDLLVHRIIALAFLGQPPKPKHHAAHKDGNKTNNNSDNLRWATAKENNADKISHGTHNRGTLHWNHKLGTEEVATIRCRLNAGEQGRKLAKEYHVSEATISLIRSRKLWSTDN